MRLSCGNFLSKLVQLSMCTCLRTESQCSTKVSEPFLSSITKLGRLFNQSCEMYKLILSGYGFVEFLSEDDADYSIKIMNMIKLFGKPVKANHCVAE